MYASHPLRRRSSRFSQPRQNPSGRTASQETALRLLSSCVQSKLSCLEEIVDYIGENTPRTRRLLEEVLKLEEQHAEKLLGILQVHRTVSSIRLDGPPVPRLAG